MTLAPFYAAPLFIKTHIVAALVVAALSPLQFWGFRQGSLPHRISGFAWLGAMVIVSASSFCIRTDFPLQVAGYGPIHLLSLLAFYSVTTSLIHARQGRIEAHRRTLRGLSIGFAVAGVFTFLPPRIMAQIIGL